MTDNLNLVVHPSTKKRTRSHATHNLEQLSSRSAHIDSELTRERERISVGSFVEVRTRYLPGQWAQGYEVVEVLPSGYRILRRSSQDVLSEVFAIDDVRVASDPLKSDMPGRTIHQYVHKIVRAQIPSEPMASPWLQVKSFVDVLQVTARRESSAVLRLSQNIGRAANRGVSPLGNLANPLGNLTRLRRMPQYLAKRQCGNVLERVDALVRRIGADP